MKLVWLSATLLLSASLWAQDTSFRAAGNPIIRHKYTADPAAKVHNGKVYLYTGHDEAPLKRNGYEMHEWLVISSPDMVNWT